MPMPCPCWKAWGLGWRARLNEGRLWGGLLLALFGLFWDECRSAVFGNFGKRSACPTKVFWEDRAMAHPPRIPVLLPLEMSVVYFITLCVDKRQRVLANTAAMKSFLSAVAKLEGKWHIHSAVLMPDHLHVIAIPFKRDARVGNLSGALKRWIRQDLRAEWQWQPGCFDHLLRSGEYADAKWEYIRENPVRLGLVKDWKDWPYYLGIDPEQRRQAPFRLEM